MEGILSRIELLKSMESYERIQLSDGMKEVKYTAGQTVIHQVIFKREVRTKSAIRFTL